MARTLDLQSDKNREKLLAMLRKATESANLNFLIGSGCSSPAIPTLGNIEKQVQNLHDEGKGDEANLALCTYLKQFLTSTATLMGSLDESHESVLGDYSAFLTVLSNILTERKSNIAPKHACVFTTNYDLFIERAYELFRGPLALSDGFNRRPSLDNSFEFTTAEYFTSVYKRGTLYSYEVQVPSVSLVKLHGSLSWQDDGNRILFSVSHLNELSNELTKMEEGGHAGEAPSLIEQFSVIMPIIEKHKDTILSQIYYDLLRIYANELDKENVLLLASGLSFEDAHLHHVTRRALRNPTLRLVIFSHREDGIAAYMEKFEKHDNVDIAYSQASTIDFAKFISLLGAVLPGQGTEAASEPNEGDDE